MIDMGIISVYACRAACRHCYYGGLYVYGCSHEQNETFECSGHNCPLPRHAIDALLSSSISMREHNVRARQNTRQ